MPGRKLLFILRRPMAVGQTDDVFLGGQSFSSGNDISVVLLNEAAADDRKFPGRTFFLQEDTAPAMVRPDLQGISYADLVKLIFEADSTVVI
jgi:hypothetical protein